MPELKKLKIDYLRDTIVEVRYEANLDFSISRGLLYAAFKDEGELLNNIYPVSIQISGQPEVRLPRSESLDFVKDQVKFSFSPGRVHFNTIVDYPGWAAYFPVIKSVLDRLTDLKLLTGVTQIGLRYISDHKMKSIAEVSSVVVVFPHVEDSIRQQSHRFELLANEDLVTVLLTDTLVPDKKGELLKQAVVDIDVIHQFTTPSTELSECLDAIEKLHLKEKEFFVKIMAKDYLESLEAEFA
jgi:uncharacterized protein (TIGR04255 family)